MARPTRWNDGFRPGIVLNLLLRLSILCFLAEVLLFPDDPRFAGKAIPVRNLVVVLSLSLLFPVLQAWLRRWPRYPVWADNLYLTIFWLDMAGNSLDLYDRYYYFDLLPHFHSTGALAAVLVNAFGLPGLSAAGLATMLHLALEAQEYYTDVLVGTHNVRGLSDTVNDLAVGLLASILYAGAAVLRRGRRTRARSPDAAASP